MRGEESLCFCVPRGHSQAAGTHRLDSAKSIDVVSRPEPHGASQLSWTMENGAGRSTLRTGRRSGLRPAKCFAVGKTPDGQGMLLLASGHTRGSLWCSWERCRGGLAVSVCPLRGFSCWMVFKERQAESTHVTVFPMTRLRPHPLRQAQMQAQAHQAG